MRIGVYPGSFDPITLGHLDVIKRSFLLVDKLIIGVLDNSTKNPLFTAEDRVAMIKKAAFDIPNVEVEAFSGLLVDYAKMKHADMIVRGLRAVTDFEYELQMAQTNKKVYPEIDTVFFTTNVEYAYLSSSVVREIAKYSGDIRQFVPEQIVDFIYQKYNNEQINSSLK